MNPDCYASNFSVGNYETLNEYIKGNHTTLSAELKHFFKTYYSANLMTVAIQTPMSIKQMEEIAIEKFGQIGNNDTKAPTF